MHFFMYMHGIPCYADETAPPSSILLVRQPRLPPIVPLIFVDSAPRSRVIESSSERSTSIIFASPESWCEAGAHNLAAAYRPEGLTARGVA